MVDRSLRVSGVLMDHVSIMTLHSIGASSGSVAAFSGSIGASTEAVGASSGSLSVGASSWSVGAFGEPVRTSTSRSC